jgi:RNA polymerase sigma factor (sigma-70 family)
LENPPTPEIELIERLKRGDEAAYRFVCTANQTRLYNAILCIVQSETDAADLTQEVFIDAFLNLENFNQKSKLSTWLYRMAINRALNHRRYWKAKMRVGKFLSIFSVPEAENKPDFVHPAYILENKERSEQLFKAIDTLPEKQRTAFVLQQQDELSYHEIAEIMQTTIPSVESLLFRAKQNLKKKLSPFD